MRVVLAAAVGAALILSQGCSLTIDPASVDRPKPACEGGAVLCGGACVTLHSDDLNCGACGARCDAGRVCSSGACALRCTTGLVSCGGSCLDPMTDEAVCGAAADCSGGVACGASQECEQGRCRALTRVVSTRLGTDHWIDDGSIIGVLGPIPGATVSVLVPDAGSQGYRVLPGSVGLDGSVTVPDVPHGDYFLRVERPYTAYVDEPSCVPACQVPTTLVETRMVQFATSTPPLTYLVAHRPDLARASMPTPVQLHITNLDPASVGPSQLWAGSSQADLDLVLARPAAGATEHVGQFDWWEERIFSSRLPPGLPSAPRGDVVHVLQRVRLPFPAWPDAPSIQLTTRAARTSDLTIVDGVGGAIDLPLAEVPLSKTISLALAATAFEALSASMAPSNLACPPEFGSTLGVGMYAAPHEISYPAPTPLVFTAFPAAPGPWLRQFFVAGFRPLTADANLGTIRYGGFLDALWAEFLLVSFDTCVQYTLPGGGTWSDGPFVQIMLPAGEVPAGKIGPTLGPPTSPRVEARDAFVLQEGVGPTPLLSWGAPSIGAPTAYEVTVVPVDHSDGGVTARLFGVESFRVPPGILKAGHYYYARITAVAGPGYAQDANPNIASMPSHRADCLTALFSP